MECVLNDDGSVDVYMSYNEHSFGNHRIPELQGSLSLLFASYENGILYCAFTREPVTTVEGQAYDLNNDKYYLLIAGGTELKG